MAVFWAVAVSSLKNFTDVLEALAASNIEVMMMAVNFKPHDATTYKTTISILFAINT